MPSQVLTRLIVTGTVQGVFFRVKTQKYAMSLGLKGYVKNLPDGTVEIGIVGEEVDLLIKYLKNEPPPVQINTISRSIHPLEEDFIDFSVR